jgi:hypothetical protein
MLGAMKWMLALMVGVLAGCAGGGSSGSVNDQQRKMIGLLQKFDLWDYNGDGLLSEQELADGMQAHQVEASMSPAEIIEFYDRDGDGKISLGEAEGKLDGLG